MARDYYDNYHDDTLVDAEYEPMTPKKQPRAKPPRVRSEGSFMSKHYRKLFLITFVLILISLLLTASTQYPEAPDRDDYDEDWETWEDDTERYDDVIRVLTVTAELLFTMGVLLLCFTMILGAFVDRLIPDKARMIMLILAVVILALFFSMGFKLQTSFG
jgi:magnesium-transporting ATPase (P-type)